VSVETDATPPTHRISVAARPWLRRALALVACTCIVVIVVLSWSPRGSIGRTGAPGPFEHVLAYLGAGFVTALATSRRHHRWIGIGLVALAGILEIGQIWVPGRTSQLIDFAGSSVGAISGIALATMSPAFRAEGPWDLAAIGARGRKAAGVGLIFVGVALTPVWIVFLLWFGFGLLARMLG
jgi:hypothetical protein